MVETASKLVPVIVTNVPGGPAVGVKAVTVGCDAVTRKLAVELVEPAELLTVIGPEMAPVGIMMRRLAALR
jgi:hypothetical protein